MTGIAVSAVAYSPPEVDRTLGPFKGGYRGYIIGIIWKSKWKLLFRVIGFRV